MKKGSGCQESESVNRVSVHQHLIQMFKNNQMKNPSDLPIDNSFLFGTLN